MSNHAIEAVNLGKRYRIGAAPLRGRNLRDALVHAAGAPVRNLRSLRAAHRATGPDDATTVWALRDVSFAVAEGEVVGVVGRNGAGKSTLLKILSRITDPSAGHADIWGRVGSLLEVGTGFHPELSGRDNVYLNGAVLGMDRRAIADRFDEIVEFAGIGAFIDTPVKRYSSGMQVRLAFAVAAHLEPEVLIVDEVLAVGDAEFQRRCLAKMDTVARGGRTVLFVSHNMNAVQRLCTRCLLIDHGRLVADGATTDVVARYLAEGARSQETRPGVWIDLADCPRSSGNGSARFEAARFMGDDPSLACRPRAGGSVEFTFAVASDAERRVGSFAVSLHDQTGTMLVNADAISLGRPIGLRAGRTLVSMRIDALHLKAGTYVVGLWMSEPTGKPVYDHVNGAFRMEVVERQAASFGATAPGPVACDFTVRELEPSLAHHAAGLS